MGFLGFETKKEKEERIKREQEQKKREEAIEKMPIYYSSAVDFKYKVIRGDLQYYTPSDYITDAWEKNIRFLKKEAYECNADCVIDAQIKISSLDEDCSEPRYIVYSTGMAVKKIEE